MKTKQILQNVLPDVCGLYPNDMNNLLSEYNRLFDRLGLSELNYQKQNCLYSQYHNNKYNSLFIIIHCSDRIVIAINVKEYSYTYFLDELLYETNFNKMSSVNILRENIFNYE